MKCMQKVNSIHTCAATPRDAVMRGTGTMVLWYGVYFSQQAGEGGIEK